MRAILFGGGLSLLISLLGTRYAIRFFTRQGFGQPIRDDGPTTHHVKRGTPTMGGAVIILATVIGYFAAKLITQSAPTASALLLLFLLVGIGAVGFLDDFLKVSRQHNLGLRSRAKMIGQTVVGLVFGFLALSPTLEDERGWRPASDHLSFIRDYEGFALPTVLAILLIWLIVTGASNAVNLADGLDGLAAGASILVFAAYTLVTVAANPPLCAMLGEQTPSAALFAAPRFVDPADRHRLLHGLRESGRLAEFLTRLRSTPGRSNTPVIVVTARDLSQHDHSRLSAMGVLRIFQKGRYDTQALTDAITESVR